VAAVAAGCAADCAGALLWLHWPQILLQSVLWQKVLHREMTQLLQQVAQQPQQAGVTLMLSALPMACCMRWGRATAKW
jgi:hypothetical protein